MAASLLLRRGQARVLKTVFLEAQVFRGLASTVPLSAESGKDQNGLPPKPEKQSVPKNVVDPKERGKLLATYPTAALSKSSSPSRSYPAAGSTGGAVAGPHPGGSVPLTDEGDPKPLSRKTLVEFPQKVPLSFQEQGSDSKVRQPSPKERDDSSSSSSSSSDSESDEEGHDSKVGSRVVSKGKGGVPRAEATHPFKNTGPQITVSSKEKARVPKPRIDVTHPEKPQQLKKGAFTKPLEGRKEAQPKPVTPRSQSSEEALEQSVKQQPLRGKLRSGERGPESQKPLEVKDIIPDHTKAGLSAGLSGSAVHTLPLEEVRAEGQLSASAPGLDRHLEPKVPEPEQKTSPLIREEISGKQVLEGHLKTKKETMEGQEPMRDLKTEPDQKKDVFDEKTAGPKLEGRCEATVDAAPHGEAQDNTQVTTEAPAPAEPFDNTSYKNLQHHDYNAYTFLDLNLDLSKFRMPQPSSGRESPRH